MSALLPKMDFTNFTPALKMGSRSICPEIRLARSVWICKGHSMQSALVVGMNKTGTTIVSSVIQNSITGARLYVEPGSVAFFEQKCAKVSVPRVVKILYEHWMQRPFLLNAIIRGETGFRPDKTVAIVRDPRDGMISALMYGAFERVVDGAGREQVDEWVEIVRDKEMSPERYSVLSLVDSFNRIFNVRYSPNGFFENFMSYSAWVADNRDYFHVLRYEDFVAGNTDELSAYLGIELSSSREVEPNHQRVARTKQSGGWRKMMLPQDVTYWRERYGSALETFGYSDWEIHPEKSDPAVGSGYILRITEEASRSVQPKPAKPAFQS
jgi:hypothetical protein